MKKLAFCLAAGSTLLASGCVYGIGNWFNLIDFGLAAVLGLLGTNLVGGILGGLGT